MRRKSTSKFLLAIAVCGFSVLTLVAQDCPARPASGTVVADPFNIVSQNGALNATFTMGHSVDSGGYTHFCYKYQAPGQVVEAPTLRVNPGDVLNLDVVDGIKNSGIVSKMNMAPPTGPACGDGGAATINSTNVHFHGMNVAPVCHQDDVLTTLIQPGTPGFQYNVQIPTTQPPGLYWYHPHVHGFTEFQVNGGAAGALIVGGMEKVRPEVAGLTERVFVVRQQYLVPWIPGPYLLTLNYQTAPFLGASPIINMKPGEKQFWRVANATIQDFLQLQIQQNDVLQPMQIIALDGYPLAQTRNETTILIPPAGRAEFIVTAPPSGQSAVFFTNVYDTGPTGNLDLSQKLANIETSSSAVEVSHMPKASAPASADESKFLTLATQPATVQRKLYFSEEFGGTNGPIQFYITVDGQKQKVFEPNEAPVITTKVGAIEDWTIENRALETHAFHIHQIHFRVLEIDGKPAPDNDLRDTIEIPYWGGNGPYHSVKVRMDFSNPVTAGTFVFHCHILLHEDLGMMHKILVEP
ncbi:MAG TPA: multicopper oxidase domain-containing protein [Candidatus Sulfotelmatobacter sp.]